MNKTKLAKAIALCIATASSTANAVDINVTEMSFGNLYTAQGQLNDVTNNLGLFESTQPFFYQDWAAASVSYFDGFNGATVTDNNTVIDTGNITNSVTTTDFGILTQTVLADPDGDPLTRDFRWSGTSGQGPFYYEFVLSPTQVAHGTLFNWSVNGGIAVLTIYECGTSGTTCSGIDGGTLVDASGSLSSGRDQVTGVINLYSFGGGPIATDANGVPVDGSGTPYAMDTSNILTDGSGVKLIIDGFALQDPDPNASANSAGWITVLKVSNMANGPFNGSLALFNGTGSDFAPVAADDSASTLVNTLVTVDVLANDSDRDETLPANTTLNITALPTNGNAVVNGANDGTIDYTPTSLLANQQDTFEYTITDSAGKVSLPGTVTITALAAPNAVPVANGFATNVNEDTSLTIDVTDTATDADSGDVLAFATFQSPSAQNGNVIANGANTILTYTSPADYSGPDTISYSVTDTKDSSSTATISITVNPVNDDPVCIATASIATGVDTVLNINGNDLTTECTDVEGDTITFSPGSASQPVNATLADDGTGNLTITPNAGFVGTDSFTFTVSDGNGGSATATATLTIGTIFSNFTMLDSAGNVFGGTNDVVFDWDGVSFNTDESDINFGLMTIVSEKPQPFFSFLWTAHHVRVYGPGTYSFDTTCTAAQYDTGTTSCGGSNPITMTVGSGQVGGHILFDWGKPSGATSCGVENCDIDVVNVWDVDGVWNQHGDTNPRNQLFAGAAGIAPDPTTTWALVSTDVNNDGINASPMVDGPFEGFYANFNSTPAGAMAGEVVPLPHKQDDTDIGDSPLASMNIFALFASLMTLFGLRHFGRKKQ